MIAEDTVRWLARNYQNAFQVVLLRTVKPSDLSRFLTPGFALAQRLGIRTGIDVFFDMRQQKAYRLISRDGRNQNGTEEEIRSSIRELIATIPMDFVSVEIGSTEFTNASSEKTLRWIDALRTELARHDKFLMVKVHASSNQHDKKYGNFNFIPQFSRPDVGILPHTVMYYGLEDHRAPVYGRRDFSDLRDFIRQESPKRRCWYYPETSYFIGMDIDVPLLLTDYLIARESDLAWIEKEGIEGQINFSTGQELGYWLFDWSVAQSVNAEARGNPLFALALLGEDLAIWKKILAFQSAWIKKAQLLPMLSSANLMDELPPPLRHSVHERHTLYDLELDPRLARAEFEKLDLAQIAAQSIDLAAVKNEELRLMLEVTFLRISHARSLRSALSFSAINPRRQTHIHEARAIRSQALEKMHVIALRHNRYPEARLFSKRSDPTSYGYGYAWPAQKLHFWEREEKMIERADYNPFFMNIYNPIQLLF